MGLEEYKIPLESIEWKKIFTIDPWRTPSFKVGPKEIKNWPLEMLIKNQKGL